LWHYKRGAARVLLNREPEARADLAIAAAPDALPWVSGRAHAEMAKLAARAGNRAEAQALAARAESLCRQGSDPACVDAARRIPGRLNGR
jgi:hypothetical protein